MYTFDITVRYRTLTGRHYRTTLRGIVAKSQTEAMTKAADMFRAARKDSRPATVVELIPEKGRPIPPAPPPQPAPIQNGERITLPLSGTVEIESADSVILHGRDGHKLRVSAAAVKRHTGRPIGPVVTVEYYSLYPNQYCYGAAQPVRTSQHGVDQLVQVKVTRHNGVIVNKEIV